MVEAGAKEVTEAQVVGALEAAHAAIKQIVAGIDDLRSGRRQEEARRRRRRRSATTFYREVEEKVYVPLSEAMRIRGKLENYDRVDQVLEEFVASLPEGEVQRKVEAKHIFHELKEKVLRDEVLERGHPARRPQVRRDPADLDARPACCRASHGSVVFTRGETQALVTCTLGTADDEQKVEHVSGEFYKRFMLHYNFPPFSVGEVAVPARPGPPRGRPRRAGRARARRRSFPARTSSPTPSASSPTSSSRTAPRRWRRCAAARWR